MISSHLRSKKERRVLAPLAMPGPPPEVYARWAQQDRNREARDRETQRSRWRASSGQRLALRHDTGSRPSEPGGAPAAGAAGSAEWWQGQINAFEAARGRRPAPGDEAGGWIQSADGRWYPRETPQQEDWQQGEESQRPWRQSYYARQRRYEDSRQRRHERSHIQLYDTVGGVNMTARQALTREDYSALRSYFGEKIDTDTRVRLCSHALVNMLRHARGLGDTVELAPMGPCPSRRS